jgi:hypothetical protein
VSGDGTVTATDYGASTITVTYVKKATSSIGPQRIRTPAARVAAGETIELIPSRRHANLGDRYEPVGPPPSTHARPPGGGAVNLQSSNAPIVAMPRELR